MVYVILTSGISIDNFFRKIVITAVTFFIPEHVFATRVTKCQKGKNDLYRLRRQQQIILSSHWTVKQNCLEIIFTSIKGRNYLQASF